MKLSHALAITLPISITLWSITALYSSKEITQLPSPFRWFLSVAVPFLVVCLAYRRNSLNMSGCVAAMVVGFVLTISNLCFTAALLTFFITSSKATHFKRERKHLLEDDFEAGSRRNWLQVVCNGGVATQLALFYLMENGPGEVSIDFTSKYNLSWWCASYLGSLCCANGDTWASELGSVLGSGDPFLITSLRRVPRGTNGGVSFVGLLVSALGGAVVAIGFYVTEVSILLIFDSYQLYSSPPQLLPLLLLGLFAGLIGSVIDSILGATLQYSGLEKKSRKVVEYRGPGIRDISGRAFLDNHSVNLLSNLITALISPPIAIRIWNCF